MCNVPFHLFLWCFFFISDITACFARLVASLLQESLYKRQMIHIHMWSTGSTRVRTWCWCEKIDKDWDGMRNKLRKKKKKHESLWYVSVLSSQMATRDSIMLRMWKGYHSNMDHRYEPWSNTDKLNYFDQIWVMFVFYIFFSFSFFLSKRLCLSIT